MDVSWTLGSNLLLQVAPYKPSVPSQVSQKKENKASRAESAALDLIALRRYFTEKVQLLMMNHFSVFAFVARTLHE